VALVAIGPQTAHPFAFPTSRPGRLGQSSTRVKTLRQRCLHSRRDQIHDIDRRVDLPAATVATEAASCCVCATCDSRAKFGDLRRDAFAPVDLAGGGLLGRPQAITSSRQLTREVARLLVGDACRDGGVLKRAVAAAREAEQARSRAAQADTARRQAERAAAEAELAAAAGLVRTGSAIRDGCDYRSPCKVGSRRRASPMCSRVRRSESSRHPADG
jgi:hypothetical protein